MVWDHLNIDKTHVAYACVGVFSTVFSLVSLFIKEKLYIGEATVAAIFGLIVGPHCLNWFAPETWGNEDYITLEISRIVLIIQIFAVAVELPKKYMLKHWLPVSLLLVPVMTAGWLIVGLFIWILIPKLIFSHALLVAACVTATDPVLAAAVVGKGKFAKRVPGHLRNLLSAESGSNDGMAFPFIYLALNLIIYSGNAAEIVKDWICVTILYECIFGCILGAVIGYCGRQAIKYAERKELIDRESFLAFYIVLSFMCAGFGSMLAVDDLLVSFAAGTAFAWDGWFAQKTEESNVSTVIDLLLNLAYFVYFGALIPWEQFNNSALGLDVWRLVILAFVVVFLRRIPAVLVTKPINKDIKNWKEALFVGHFGPVGVGAVFAAILTIGELEAHVEGIEHGPTKMYPESHEYYQLIRVIWPIVCFIILTSIIIHGSSVAVMTLGRHLQTMTFTMTFTRTETEGGGWTNRLPKLEASGTSFSIHRIDTMAQNSNNGLADRGDGEVLSQSDTLEMENNPTARPAGGARTRHRREKLRRRKRGGKAAHKKPPVAETLDLGLKNRTNTIDPDDDVDEEEREERAQEGYIKAEDQEFTKGKESSSTSTIPLPLTKSRSITSEDINVGIPPHEIDLLRNEYNLSETDLQPQVDRSGDLRIPSAGYADGSRLIIEDQHGEVLHTVRSRTSLDSEASPDGRSMHSITSLRRELTNNVLGSLANLSRRSSRREQDDTVLPSIDGVSRVVSTSSEDFNEKMDDPDTTAEIIAMKKIDDLKKSSKQKKIPLGKKTTRGRGRGQRLHGFRADDHIILENDEGEIIGRYKLNHKKRPRPRSDSKVSLYGSALQMIGLGKSSTAQGVSKTDLKEKVLSEEDLEANEISNAEIIPQQSPNADFHRESKLERKLKVFIKSDPRKARLTDHDLDSEDDSEEIDSIDSEESYVYGYNQEDDDEEEDDDEDSDHETAAERARRLAALAKSQRNDDDEEDIPKSSKK